MFTTMLNEAKFKVGTVVVLTDNFNKFAKPLIKANGGLKNAGEFEILAVRTTNASDEQTDLEETVIGATKLKNVKTGEIFDIDDVYLDEKDDYWAFFTSFTPEYFIKKVSI